MATPESTLLPSASPRTPGAVYFVDASVFIFRAYYSVPINLTDADGNPVNALHGFARFIGDLIERERPAHIAVAFDESVVSSSFRNKLFPAYKANREAPPAELKAQMILCRRACEAMGIACYSSPEYEADDIIGTLVTRVRAAGRKVVVVTRDKDLSQLIRPGDEYWDYIADLRYAYEQIADRFGVVPERMADYLAVTGDAVDNIRGVPGVGPKTAAMIFKRFESALHLYDDLDAVHDLKVRNAGFVVSQLREHKEAVFLARQLTEIACNMPLEADLEALKRKAPDLFGLDRIYDAARFGRLLRNQAERIARLGC